jgi:tRNA(Ile2) C34 agmatinyltransferase TiaS
MQNTGKCPCGGYIVFESISSGGKTQTWRCTDCEQIYYRTIFSMELFKTMKELEEAAA